MDNLINNFIVIGVLIINTIALIKSYIKLSYITKKQKAIEKEIMLLKHYTQIIERHVINNAQNIQKNKGQ